MSLSWSNCPHVTYARQVHLMDQYVAFHLRPWAYQCHRIWHRMMTFPWSSLVLPSFAWSMSPLHDSTRLWGPLYTIKRIRYHLHAHLLSLYNYLHDCSSFIILDIAHPFPPIQCDLCRESLERVLLSTIRHFESAYLFPKVSNGIIVCVCQKVHHLGILLDVILEMVHQIRAITLMTL